MRHALRFGILTLPNVPWPELAVRWRFLESLGFDSIWNCDHYANPYAPQEPWYEGWTSLAALALQTERIRVGMLVACASFRNPVLAAKEALTVDHVSGGRLELGIGAGYDAAEYRMMGMPLPSAAERVGRFREVVEMTDRLFRGETMNYQGTYYEATDAVLRPAPLQRPRPPLTLAGSGPQMLKIVARYADSWNSGSDLVALSERRAFLAAECAALGRDPAAIRISILCNPRHGPDEWIDPWESPDAFTERIRSYVTAGATEFIFYWPFDEAQVPRMERIARETLPALRAADVQGKLVG